MNEETILQMGQVPKVWITFIYSQMTVFWTKKISVGCQRSRATPPEIVPRGTLKKL